MSDEMGAKYQQIAADLRQAVTDGSYGPGDRLPGENDLMERYRVARMTARRALAELVHEGLALPRQGAGTFVRSAVPFDRLMEYAASLTEEDLLEEPLDQLAARVGVFPERLSDAIVAVRVTRASPVSIRAVMHPAVRRAVEDDKRGMTSGFTAPDLFSE
jgi:GntR family transcriptional regulator